MNTVIGEPFRNFFHEKCEERNRIMLIERQQALEILPSLREIFNNFSYISSVFNQSSIFNISIKLYFH